MITGEFLWYDPERKFGFIKVDDSYEDGDGENVFVHCSELTDSYTVPREGDRCTFTIGQGHKGPYAESVKLI